MTEQPQLIGSVLEMGMELGFYLTFVIFTLYTLSLAYHWYAYGTHKATATLSLAVFLLGSAPLFLVMAISL